ncbi:AAA family ATPase [Candidatus Bathyarchaeota archaeon]|nr:AAA family ATPase [Candidatus Bathyarchaeota archaeon]
MTSSLYMDGPKSCGKTILSFGLVQKFKENNFKVSYFKPFSIGIKDKNGKIIDSDVIAMKEALGLENTPEEISPIVQCVCGAIFQDIDSNIAKMKILRTYESIKSLNDIILIEGSKLSERYKLMVDRISALLNSKSILITKYGENRIVETAIHYRDLFINEGTDFTGLIINSVPVNKIEETKEMIIPALRRFKIHVYGVIPQKLELIPTVKDVVEGLKATILTGKGCLDRSIGDFLVTDMNSEAGLVYWFKRSLNQTMMRGGDKTELILESMGTDLSAIIMCGNSHPTDKIINKADEMTIPILSTSLDEFTAMVQIGKVTDIVTPTFLQKKGEIIKRMIEEHVNWEGILNKILVD